MEERIKIDYIAHEADMARMERIHSKRDRAVMFDRYANGLTYEQLADKYDISVNTVKRIIHKYDFILIKISE